MADQLKSGAAAPSGPQTVVITQGNQLNTTVQAPTSSGNIWFAYSVGSGQVNLTVNFNGQTYNNVPPGDYQLAGLTTPLGLTVQGNGSAKLAWVAS